MAVQQWNSSLHLQVCGGKRYWSNSHLTTSQKSCQGRPLALTLFINALHWMGSKGAPRLRGLARLTACHLHHSSMTLLFWYHQFATFSMHRGACIHVMQRGQKSSPPNRREFFSARKQCSPQVGSDLPLVRENKYLRFLFRSDGGKGCWFLQHPAAYSADGQERARFTSLNVIKISLHWTTNLFEGQHMNI